MNVFCKGRQDNNPGNSLSVHSIAHFIYYTVCNCLLNVICIAQKLTRIGEQAY